MGTNQLGHDNGADAIAARVEKPDLAELRARALAAQQTIAETPGMLDGFLVLPSELLPLIDRAAAAEAAVARAHALADRWEHGALRWADPLPVPPHVGLLRDALDYNQPEKGNEDGK